VYSLTDIKATPVAADNKRPIKDDGLGLLVMQRRKESISSSSKAWSGRILVIAMIPGFLDAPFDNVKKNEVVLA